MNQLKGRPSLLLVGMWVLACSLLILSCIVSLLVGVLLVP